MKSKQRLGKGLQALIPSIQEDDAVSSGGSGKDLAVELAVERIEHNPMQPRQEYDPESLNELKQSIKEKGIIQPIVVRSTGNGRYQIVAGERRFRAAVELGLKTVPVRIMEVEEDRDLLELALVENVQRENLNPIDLALSYQRLMDEYHLTQEEVAQKIGKDRATVANVVRLLKLPRQIQESLRRGEIREGHARALLGLKDAKKQEEVWRKVVKNKLSVRKVEQLVKKLNEEDLEKPPTRPRKNVFIVRIEEQLREKFGTQVKIRPRKEGGAIEIVYYSNEDLERLIEMFNQIPY